MVHSDHYGCWTTVPGLNIPSFTEPSIPLREVCNMLQRITTILKAETTHKNVNGEKQVVSVQHSAVFCTEYC